MLPDYEIRFGFAFDKSANLKEYPLGIKRVLYSISGSGSVHAINYAALAIDYVPRVCWAFESQGRLSEFKEYLANIESRLLIFPLPQSSGWSLNLGWCNNILAEIIAASELSRPRIGVVSRFIADAPHPRAILNPIAFSFFNRPTFGMHLATLNAVSEAAALMLDEEGRSRFVLALQEIISVCRHQPGFWNDPDGAIRSATVVDQVLQKFEFC
jgi:hypothetical protein